MIQGPSFQQRRRPPVSGYSSPDDGGARSRSTVRDTFGGPLVNARPSGPLTPSNSCRTSPVWRQTDSVAPPVQPQGSVSSHVLSHPVTQSVVILGWYEKGLNFGTFLRVG